MFIVASGVTLPGVTWCNIAFLKWAPLLAPPPLLNILGDFRGYAGKISKKVFFRAKREAFLVIQL